MTSPKPTLYFIPRPGAFHEEGGDSSTEMSPLTRRAAEQPPSHSPTYAATAEGKRNEEPPIPPPQQTHTHPRVAQRWSWWRWATGRGGYESIPSVESNLPRKVPVRVEPKVFFANERTYLAWLHMAVMMATISVAIVALAEKEGPSGESAKIYGVVMMPVAIAFCGYALHMYLRRLAMLKRRAPGPFDDRVGPTVLGVMLIIAIVSSFSIKLYVYAS